jgi:hypothetical protein
VPPSAALLPAASIHHPSSPICNLQQIDHPSSVVNTNLELLLSCSYRIVPQLSARLLESIKKSVSPNSSITPYSSTFTMVMIISALAVVSFSILWADLDRAEAFQPGRAFISRPQQHQQHQQLHSLSTTLWATKANATTADPASFGVPTTPTSSSLSSDWIADDFSVHPERFARSNNVVVGPSQMLIYDTSLRGT